MQEINVIGVSLKIIRIKLVNFREKDEQEKFSVPPIINFHRETGTFVNVTIFLSFLVEHSNSLKSRSNQPKTQQNAYVIPIRPSSLKSKKLANTFSLFRPKIGFDGLVVLLQSFMPFIYLLFAFSARETLSSISSSGRTIP